MALGLSESLDFNSCVLYLHSSCTYNSHLMFSLKRLKTSELREIEWEIIWRDIWNSLTGSTRIKMSHLMEIRFSMGLPQRFGTFHRLSGDKLDA